MRGWIVMGIVFFMLLLTGCSGNEKEITASAKIQDETSIAWSDDFTRKFMDSKKEVKDGYHLYKSMTDGYTMLFPVEAKVVKEEYAVNANIFEQYHIMEEDKKQLNNFQVTYENRTITSDLALNLDVLSNVAGYDGEFKEYQHDGNTYYYAKNISEKEGSTKYQYLSYIKSNKSNQAVSYCLNSTCLDGEKPCKLDSKKLEKEFKTMIESVEFME